MEDEFQDDRDKKKKKKAKREEYWPLFYDHLNGYMQGKALSFSIFLGVGVSSHFLRTYLPTET
jgi:hypothetical protein